MVNITSLGISKCKKCKINLKKCCLRYFISVLSDFLCLDLEMISSRSPSYQYLLMAFSKYESMC